MPPKCGSRSLVEHLCLVGVDLLGGPATLVIRHPWDRIVSALESNYRSDKPFLERLLAHVPHDDHVMPYSHWIEGQQIKRIVRTENLDQEFPGIGHRNVGRYRQRWQDYDIDWAAWQPVYARDVALCNC